MSSKTFMAVDIGNKNIKMLCGEEKSNKVILKEYEIRPTPPDAINNGVIKNLNVIVDIIKTFKATHKSKHMILLIGGSSIITRDLQLPKSTDEEIEKILQYEAQQYLPVNLENYSYDFKVAEEIMVDGESMYRVMLVAVPIIQVEEYMKLHERLKVELEAIDISSSGVQKSIFQLTAESDTIYPNEFAVLDIGSEKCEVFMFKNMQLKSSRLFLMGSNLIDQMISNTYNMDFKAAEEYKKTKGSIYFEEMPEGISEQDVYLSTLIKSSLEKIIDEVIKFFDYYISREGAEKIEKIYLIGGGSKISGIEVFISSVIGIPVEYIESCTNIEYKGEKSLKKFEEDRLQLFPALGCLIRGL